jgi:hypothetical protein
MSITTELVCESRTYEITFDENSTEPPNWVEVSSGMVLPISRTHQLNRQFLDNNASDVLTRWGKEHLNYYFFALRSIGASEDDLRRLGLGVLIESENIQEDFSESPLHAMGYRVGNHGMPVEQRRKILQEAFIGDIPIVGPITYMAAWGLPGTSQRLAAIVHHIQKVRIISGNPESDLSKAKADWLEDLSWLKETFYDGHFDFPWYNFTPGQIGK